MNPRIEVTARSVYGSILLYPANDQATRLAALVGTKTLTVTVLSIAKSMGFEILISGDVRAVEAARESLDGK